MALRKNGKLLIGNSYNAYESDRKNLENIWGMSHSADMLNGIGVTDDDEVLICANFSGVNFRRRWSMEETAHTFPHRYGLSPGRQQLVLLQC